MPMSNKVLDNFNLSQFKSTVVDPTEIPKICVCTAPDAPTIHRSEFIEVIAGAIAEGGGDFTVVSEYEFVVLREVESVMIGSD